MTDKTKENNKPEKTYEDYKKIYDDAQIYCNKFYEWAKIIRERYAEENKKPVGARYYPHDENFIEHLDAVILAITKSSLLRRSVYENEEIRKTPCKLHNGRWNGCYPERPIWHKKQMGYPDEDCTCWDGFECSGWEPEKD